MDAAGATNHHMGNGHHPSSRTNSLEPQASSHETKDHAHRGSKDHEDGHEHFGIFAAAEQRRQRQDIRNKKVNWKESRPYDKLGSTGESSQGEGGQGIPDEVVSSERDRGSSVLSFERERGPELEPLLNENYFRDYHEYQPHRHQHDHHHLRHRNRDKYYYHSYDFDPYYEHYYDRYYDRFRDRYHDRPHHHRPHHHHHRHHHRHHRHRNRHCHHHLHCHICHHHHRPSSYQRHHSDTYASRSSIRYRKVSIHSSVLTSHHIF